MEQTSVVPIFFKNRRGNYAELGINSFHAYNPPIKFRTFFPNQI